jgi:hypothetical protein
VTERTFAHGHADVRSYRQGCRCTACRVAHAAYRRDRRQGCQFPDPSEHVDALPARQHLAMLRAQGVGYRQAAHLAHVSEPRILNIRTGALSHIRADTQTRILSVRAILAHGQTVTGWRTWRLLDSLKREGYTQGRIAHLLEHQAGQLQIGRKHCTVKTALHVRALYRYLNREGDPSQYGSSRLNPSRHRSTHVTEETLPAARSRSRRQSPDETPARGGHRQVG